MIALRPQEIAPLAGALLPAVISIVAYVVRRQIERRQLKEIDEARFNRVVESDSLRILGGYLESAVAPITLESYAYDSKVRRRVDRVLELLTDYLGRPEEIRATPKAEPEVQIPSTGWSVASGQFDDWRYLLYAHPWDALARLRRLVETRLRDRIKELAIDVPSRIGAAGMIDVLARNQAISRNVANDLLASVNVASRAIHGGEVTMSEAEQAIWRALAALQRMDALSSP